MPQGLTAYVKARAADGDGRVDAAAANYGKALRAAPGNPVIAVRAYREALDSGDMGLAREAAATMAVAGIAPADATLLAISDAVRARRWDEAAAAATRLDKGPLDFLAPVISAWIALERGAKPGALLAESPRNALARRFTEENRALLMIAGGEVDRGVVALRGVLTAGSDAIDLRIAAAQLLANRGRTDLVDAVLAGSDPVLADLRTHIGRGAPPSAAFGVSRLFIRLASDLVVGEAKPLAIALGRSALELDPTFDRARLVLAGTLANSGANAPALTLIDAVRADGGYADGAQVMRMTILSRDGRKSDALELAERLSRRKGADAEDAQRLGDLLVEQGRYDEAAAAYATAIERAGPAADWTLYLQRGGALDQAGRWDEAEAVLARAVSLAPDQAEALNYLGYARIERGEDVAEARAMLERASKLKPDDAAITDSLGWAYVQTGQVTKGLPLLERAARAEPGDVTIQEHLGDAYWRVGRRYEARYAWRAASVYADGKDATRIAGKLAGGLK